MWVGNWYIGESLFDDGDLYVVVFEYFIWFICWFILFGVKDICV